MAGFLDLQTPASPGIGGLLGADFQRQAAMQNIIGTLIGFGQGPSSVPLGFGARMAQAAKAGQQSQRDYETQQLQQALVGSQIGKLQQDAQQKRNLQASIAAMPDGPEKTRLMWAVNGVNPDQIAGSVPTKFGYESNGAVKPAYLQSIGETTAAEEVPKAGAAALKTWLSFHPDVPITAGGGSQPQGASPEDAQSAINRLLGPNPMGQRSGGMPPPGAIQGGAGTQGLRGDAGMDDLTSPGGTTPTRVGGLPITNTADSGGIQLPPMRSRGVVPSTVPPAAVYGVEQKPRESFGDEKGKVYGKAFAAIQDGNSKAGAMEGNIAFMRGLNVQGGALTPFLAGLGGMAQAIGVDPKTVERLVGVNVADAQAFDASSKELVYNMLGSLGTGVSNVDRDFVEKIVPTLRTTPGATDKLFDYMQAKIDWQKARWLNAFEADMAQGGKDVYAPLKADAAWKKANPFTEWMKNPEAYPALNAPKAAPDAPVPEAKPEREPNIPTFKSPDDPNLRLKPPGFQFYDPNGKLRVVPGRSAP